MVLPEVDVTEPQDVAERLRQVIVQRPFDAVAVILDFNISLDLADLNPSNTAFASILKRADEALYAFKRAGQSKVVQIL